MTVALLPFLEFIMLNIFVIHLKIKAEHLNQSIADSYFP